MKSVKVTSAVAGVGSSRRGNTSTKGRLESLSIYVKRTRSLHGYFQIYAIIPTYVYKSTPMPKDQAMVQYGSSENQVTTPKKGTKLSS